MPGISSLPPEMLLEVFSFLPVEELLDNIPRVCTTWRELSRHPSLWEHFVYSDEYSSTVEEAIKFVEKCPMLRHICTFLYDDLYPDSHIGLIAAVIQHCSDLRSFCVNFGWHSFTLYHLNAILVTFPNLESVEVKVEPDSAAAIMDRLGWCNKLKKLTVRGRYYSDDLLKPIVDRCVSLEYLHCEVPDLPEEDHLYVLQNMCDRLLFVQFNDEQPVTQNVINALGSFTKLKELTLSHTAKSGSINYSPLFSVKTLKSLTFSCYARNMKECDSLFYAMVRDPLPMLRKLSVTLSVLCDLTILQDVCVCYSKMESLVLRYEYQEGTRDTFENMGRLEQLRCLVYTAGKGMTDEDVMHIARCRSLRHLELEGCDKLTDRAISHLLNCKWLEYLCLRCCSLSSQILQVIPEHFPRLRSLHLDSSTFELKDLEAIYEKKPSLDIYTY